MRTAAIQFGFSPKSVTSVAIGARTKEQITENINSLKVNIPGVFWQELKDKGLIMKEAETTVKKIII